MSGAKRAFFDQMEREAYAQDQLDAGKVLIFKGAPRPSSVAGETNMGLIASDSGGGDFKLIPAGVHIGRCFRIVDLGTQEETFEGESKLMPKLAIYWELHGEAEDGTPLMADNGEPLIIWQEYTRSLGQKAKLRSALESWRGKPFSEDELKGFDISKLLNAYCMVNVTHKQSQKGKTYANVASLTPLPAALRHAKPNPVLPSAVFDLDNFNEKLFETFHEKLKEKINNSIERKGGTKASAAPSKGNAEAKIPASAYASDDVDSDIPFVSSCFGHDMAMPTERLMRKYSF